MRKPRRPVALENPNDTAPSQAASSIIDALVSVRATAANSPESQKRSGGSGQPAPAATAALSSLGNIVLSALRTDDRISALTMREALALSARLQTTLWNEPRNSNELTPLTSPRSPSASTGPMFQPGRQNVRDWQARERLHAESLEDIDTSGIPLFPTALTSAERESSALNLLANLEATVDATAVRNFIQRAGERVRGQQRGARAPSTSDAASSASRADDRPFPPGKLPARKTHKHGKRRTVRSLSGEQDNESEESKARATGSAPMHSAGDPGRAALDDAAGSAASSPGETRVHHRMLHAKSESLSNADEIPVLRRYVSEESEVDVREPADAGRAQGCEHASSDSVVASRRRPVSARSRPLADRGNLQSIAGTPVPVMRWCLTLLFVQSPPTVGPGVKRNRVGRAFVRLCIIATAVLLPWSTDTGGDHILPACLALVPLAMFALHNALVNVIDSCAAQSVLEKLPRVYRQDAVQRFRLYWLLCAVACVVLGPVYAGLFVYWASALSDWANVALFIGLSVSQAALFIYTALHATLYGAHSLRFKRFIRKVSSVSRARELTRIYAEAVDHLDVSNFHFSTSVGLFCVATFAVTIITSQFAAGTMSLDSGRLAEEGGETVVRIFWGCVSFFSFASVALLLTIGAVTTSMANEAADAVKRYFLYRSSRFPRDEEEQLLVFTETRKVTARLQGVSITYGFVLQAFSVLFTLFVVSIELRSSYA